MYSEFLFVIIDYFSILNKRIAIYEWGVPILLGITSGVFAIHNDVSLYNVIQNSVPVIATLLGFTLAALTLFLTGNSKIEEAKNFMTDKVILGKKISQRLPHWQYPPARAAPSCAAPQSWPPRR